MANSFPFKLLPLDRIRSRPDPKDFLPSLKVVPLASLPSEASLEAIMGRILNQGAEGACTGHAQAGMMTHLDLRAARATRDYARAFIYYEARKREGTTAQDPGAQIRDTLQVLVDEGVPPEADMPYVAGQFTQAPPPQAYSDAAQFKLDRYEALPSYTYVCNALGGDNRAVSCGTYWYPEWFNPLPGGFLPEPTSAPAGGHDLLACGYKYLVNPQTNTQELYIRWHNSWGETWGDGTGHCWVRAATFDQHCWERWVGYHDAQAPQPQPAPTVDASFTPLMVTGSYAFVTLGKSLKAQGIDIAKLVATI